MRPSVLIIKHGALGDLIQAIGLFKELRLHFSHAHITLLTAPAYASLMQQCPYLDQVWTDDRRDKQQVLPRLLSAGHFDWVIDLQNSDRSRWYRWRWLRQARWIARPWWAPAPTSGLAGLIKLFNQHGIATTHARQPDLSWLVMPQSACQMQFALPQAYVALIPGASRQHPAKRWPHYAALAERLHAKGYMPLAILGPDEANLAERLPCRCVSGLDWPALASVLAHAQAVVGNDTGPSHLAAHVGARGLALFGPTSAQRAEIDTLRFHSWQVETLAALSVDDVWARLQTLLSVDTFSEVAG